MAERQFSEGRPEETEITIPAHDAAPVNRPVTIILTTEGARRYTVWQKDIPDEIQGATYQGSPVIWVNNFGLKRVGSDDYEATVSEPYTVILDEVPAEATAVYHDGRNVRPLGTTPAGGGRVEATLDLGDPPVGWTG